MPDFSRTCCPKKYADPIENGHRLEMTVALQAAHEFRRKLVPLMILGGDPGTGKSTAAAWALWDWWCTTIQTNPVSGYRWGYEGRCWVGAPHLANLQAWTDAFKSLFDPWLLVIDDLGIEEHTPKSMALLSQLVTDRFADAKPTIITTNLNGPAFAERYQTRITDRLRECGLDDEGLARWWIKTGKVSLRGVTKPEPRVEVLQ